MSDETVERKITLDDAQSAAVAATEALNKKIQESAQRFERHVQKKAQRFEREIAANSQKLGRALAASLGVDLPGGWRAWCRPDGVGEVIFREPKPTPPVETPAPKTDAPALAPATKADRDHKHAPDEGDGKIVPMPVAATNGAAK